MTLETYRNQGVFSRLGAVEIFGHEIFSKYFLLIELDELYHLVTLVGSTWPPPDQKKGREWSKMTTKMVMAFWNGGGECDKKNVHTRR